MHLKNYFQHFKDFLLAQYQNFLYRKQPDFSSKSKIYDQNEVMLAEETNITNNFFSYGELTAEDIMVPRAEIDAIDISTSINKIKKYIEEKRHTRFPIYSGSLDNIVGYINIKDLLPLIFAKKKFNINDVIREIVIVPHSIKIIKLLSKMRKNKTHIAMVVDEYGGADGLITLEDIIEQIIGDLSDEHDLPLSQNFTMINENTMVASARLEIKDFEREFGVQILSPDTKENDFDTISGLVLSLTRHVPVKGEKVTHPSGIEIEIIDSDPRKINKVIIRKLI